MNHELEQYLTKLNDKMDSLAEQLQSNRNATNAIVSLLEKKGIIADNFEFVVELAKQEKKVKELREELFNIPKILD